MQTENPSLDLKPCLASVDEGSPSHPAWRKDSGQQRWLCQPPAHTYMQANLLCYMQTYM